MRVNVYGEEYKGHRVELITKVVDDEHTFYGIRLYLKFPNQEWWVHRKVDGQPDDDSSAVTIWGTSKAQLRHLLHSMMLELSEDNVPVGEGLELTPWDPKVRIQGNTVSGR